MMKIGVCGIACEKCPMSIQERCPNGEECCTPKDNKMCRIATCAFRRGMKLCFECDEFPCETTKLGPIKYEYCRYISGKGF